jgi:Integrase core domain
MIAHRVAGDWNSVAEAAAVDPGFIEFFNGRLRDECLNECLFASLVEARKVIKNLAHRLQHSETTLEPRRTHNHGVCSPPQPGAYRLHSSTSPITPLSVFSDR